MSIPHPIPYQGSKRNLATEIIQYIPRDAERLIEPFAGSAAISLAAASTQNVKHFVINDANIPLINLWDSIINHPQQLSGQYHCLWEEQKGREKEYYNWIRDRFNQTSEPQYLLYLLARCVKASVRYNAHGEFNQSPDNRRCGTHPSTMQSNILRASYLLRDKTTLKQGDFRETVFNAKIDDVIYMDPPYQGVCGRRNPRYSNGLDTEDFIDALAEMNRHSYSYLISYDGRTGEKNYGQPLPKYLQLKQIEIQAGRSSQATLLGRNDHTYESLYLSPALVSRLNAMGGMFTSEKTITASLFSITYDEPTSITT